MEELIRSTYGEPLMMRKSYGEALLDLGNTCDNVVALSADVSNKDIVVAADKVMLRKNR